MNFTAIDFETANNRKDSPCEIGLTFVENGQIVDTKSWLIKPKDNYFLPFNTRIHGIAPEDVEDSPEFDQLWPEISHFIEGNTLIAHYAGFDIKVLLDTLRLYELELPTFSCACSYVFSKKVWKGLPGYDLKTLCAINEIPLIHHRAGNDSRAAAELALKAFKDGGVLSFDDFSEKLQINLGGTLFGEYTPSRSKRLFSKGLEDLIGDPELHNTDSIFYGKKVVFTGALTSMIRNDAMQLVLNIGGRVGDSVSKDTDFLVVGQQDFRVVGEDGMSSKQEKALRLINKGSELEVLSEDDFLKNL